MKKAPNLKNAVEAIKEKGVLLVFPLSNRRDPASLWHFFFPKSEMKWEWDENGDDRVSKLWILREELSRSKKVVYTKWFRGRATFFSKEVFTGLLSLFLHETEELPLSRNSKDLLDILEMDSPLSTKELKEASGLQGKFYEPTYTKALKELWERLLIVGFGEIDDGAFPSLAMGATKNLFEELYLEAKEMPKDEAKAIVARAMTEGSAWDKFLKQRLKKVEELRASSHLSGGGTFHEAVQD